MSFRNQVLSDASKKAVEESKAAPVKKKKAPAPKKKSIFAKNDEE